MQNQNGVILILEQSTALSLPLPKIFDYLNLNDNTHLIVDIDQIENIIKYIRTYDQMKQLIQLIQDGCRIQEKAYTIKDKIDLFYELIATIYRFKDSAGLSGVVKKGDELLNLFTAHTHLLGERLILQIMEETANDTDQITKRYILKLFTIIVSKKMIFPQFIYALDYDAKQRKLKIESNKLLIKALKDRSMFFNQPNPQVDFTEDEIIERLLILHLNSVIFLEFAQTLPPEQFVCLILAKKNKFASALLEKIQEYGKQQFIGMKEKQNEIQIKLAYLYVDYSLKKNIIDINFMEFINLKCVGSQNNSILALYRIPDLLNKMLNHKSFRKFNEETKLSKVLDKSIQITERYLQDIRQFYHLILDNQLDSVIRLLIIFNFTKDIFHHKILELSKQKRIARMLKLMKSYQGNNKKVQFGISLYISIMESANNVTQQSTKKECQKKQIQYEEIQESQDEDILFSDHKNSQDSQSSDKSHSDYIVTEDEYEQIEENQEFEENQEIQESNQNEEIKDYQSIEEYSYNEENEEYESNSPINLESDDEKINSLNCFQTPESLYTQDKPRKQMQALYLIQKLLESKKLLPQLLNFLKIDIDDCEFSLGFNFSKEFFNTLENSQQAYNLIKNNLLPNRQNNRRRLFSLDEVQFNRHHNVNEKRLIMSYINLLNRNKHMHCDFYLRKIKQFNLIFMIKQLIKQPKVNVDYSIGQFKEDLDQINEFLDNQLQLPK